MRLKCIRFCNCHVACYDRVRQKTVKLPLPDGSPIDRILAWMHVIFQPVETAPISHRHLLPLESRDSRFPSSSESFSTAGLCILPLGRPQSVSLPKTRSTSSVRVEHSRLSVLRVAYQWRRVKGVHVFQFHTHTSTQSSNDLVETCGIARRFQASKMWKRERTWTCSKCEHRCQTMRLENGERGTSMLRSSLFPGSRHSLNRVPSHFESDAATRPRAAYPLPSVEHCQAAWGATSLSRESITVSFARTIQGVAVPCASSRRNCIAAEPDSPHHLSEEDRFRHDAAAEEYRQRYLRSQRKQVRNTFPYPTHSSCLPDPDPAQKSTTHGTAPKGIP